MARTTKQYENEIRTIVVAALSKELRKSGMIKKIVNYAKSNNQVVTKRLTLPSASGSITPSTDDRWLVKRDSVKVKVSSVSNGVPKDVRVNIKLEYGFDFEYLYLTEKVKSRKKWWPNPDALKLWVKNKASRGNSFEYKGRQMNPNKESEVSSVAYLIGKHISKKGIKPTKLASPFDDKRNGVKASIAKANAIISRRIYELYVSSASDSVDEIFRTF